MHLTTIVCLLFLALTAFAQTSGTGDADVAAAAAKELLLELNQLPTCAVCITAMTFNHSGDIRTDCVHNRRHA
jgi:hypothetical protein